mmetsp:Transcript_107143/g.212689  ORF Transcript_107143/g.212689 Transcript_107143/m.212689 type:complete len:211 (+) Transcript_107143:550-1182(+)
MVVSDMLAPKPVLLEALSWNGCSEIDAARNGCSEIDAARSPQSVAATTSGKSAAAASCVVPIANGCGCCCCCCCCCGTCAGVGCGNVKGCTGDICAIVGWCGGDGCLDAPCAVAVIITADAPGCGGDGTTTEAAGAAVAVAAQPNFQCATGCDIRCTRRGEVGAPAPTGALQLPGPGVQEVDPQAAKGCAVIHGQGTCAQRDVASGARGD